MSQKYYTLLTTNGAASLANATALGIPLKLTHMAVGDANGSIPQPIATQTKLVHEVRRAAINTLFIDENNPNQIIAEQVIPETEGGWFIHEIGLFDDKGNLIAVGNCPSTYKPQLIEGSGRTQVIRMIIIVDNVDSVEIKIDPSVVLATRQYVDDALTTHIKSTDHPDATTKSKGFVQLSSATDSNSESTAATSKAVSNLKSELSNYVKTSGDTINDHLDIFATNAMLRLKNYSNQTWSYQQVENGGVSFIYSPDGMKWFDKLRFDLLKNEWLFENINDIKVNGFSLLPATKKNDENHQPIYEVGVDTNHLGRLTVNDYHVLTEETATGRLLNIIKFDKSGTYTPSNEAKFIIVEAVGGGAAGGGSTASNTETDSIGGGGGAGGYCKSKILISDIGKSTLIIIGAGGSGVTSTSGGNGGDTKFGTILTAGGGKSGTKAGPSGASFAASGGAGGIATGGSILNINGGAGTHAFNVYRQVTISGVGGNSMLGSGSITSGNGHGINATNYGAGGSGSAVAGGATGSYRGGNGYQGMVIIWEYA